jgi:tetratricopeptide (TPR) repeat protein
VSNQSFDDDDDQDEPTRIARADDDLLKQLESAADDDDADEPRTVMAAAGELERRAKAPLEAGPMFSRDPSAARAVLPDPEEGDALLDLLLDDSKDRPTPIPGEASPAPHAASNEERRRAAETPPVALAAPMATPRPAPAAPPRAAAAANAARPAPPPISIEDDLALDEPSIEDEPATRMATSPLAELGGEAAGFADEGDDGAGGDVIDYDEPATDDASEAGAEPPLPPGFAAMPKARPPRVRGAKSFPNERDASLYVADTDRRDAWIERAEWLKAEAEALGDKTARARALMVVAELYAQAGEEETARTIAREARDTAPTLPLAGVALRGLLVRDSDFRAALDAAESEMRTAASPEARVHAALMGAELSRIKLGEQEIAQKRLDVALRVMPTDPRAHLQRFAEALAAGAVPVRPKLADAPALEPLFTALAQVTALRTPSAKASPPATSVEEGFGRARAAFSAGDTQAALSHLDVLSQSGELGAGAGWLHASLAAGRAETRKAALASLDRVARGSHADLARRTMVALALEAGELEAARKTVAEPGGAAFTPADRLAIAALAGAPGEELAPWLMALDEPAYAPLVSAALAAGSAPSEPDRKLEHVGEAPWPSLQRAGRALARSALTGAVDDLFLAQDHLSSDVPESGLARALGSELDLARGDLERIAVMVALAGEERGAQGALAAAMVAELAGDDERAKAQLDAAREAEPSNEAAARIRAAHASGAEAAKILHEHAQSLEGERAAPMLLEAAVRLANDGDVESAEAAYQRAHEVDPGGALAPFLAERAARRASERERLLDWLRRRREASDDLLEQAHDLVREALLLAEEEQTAAASLLAEASRARPTDHGLRELYERLSPDALPDRAAWRAERAAEAQGSEAARLALEAALELERAGDLEGAHAAIKRALEAGDALLAPLCQQRLAIAGQGTQDLIDSLLPKAREAADKQARFEIYELLAELDERGRGDLASGLLWRRSILEEEPQHLPTLRRVASDLVSMGRDDELEPIALEIAKAVGGSESVAHAMLSARLRLRAGTWDDMREPVRVAARHEPKTLWVLRQLSAHARVEGQHAEAARVDRELMDRVDRPNEIAALALRASYSARAAGQDEVAGALLASAAESVPNHLLVNLELAHVREALGDVSGAAEALEQAASAAATDAERARALYGAAVIWGDQASDPERSRHDLEAVAAIDPAYADVFERLRTIYTASGARAELAALLESRLERVSDPTERVEMEVLRGRALADVGDAEAAKRALKAALDASPEHVEALQAYADVCASDGDWSGAEEAWIHLARLIQDQEQQIAIWRKLGDLYLGEVSGVEPNLGRARISYLEILKRRPEDEGAREKLVEILQQEGNVEQALSEQQSLLEAAATPELKCKRNIGLARIYEASGDLKKAEAVLVAARKNYPKDEGALGALASYYGRNNQAPAAQVLLDRALTDARRALTTGRFEPYLFATVATVAELRGNAEAARCARSAVAALEGAPAAMAGAGADAGDPELDDLLAPEIMTPAFRDLLRASGPLLDTAYAYDLGSIRAAPLQGMDGLVTAVEGIAASYRLGGLEVLHSPVLGSVVLPVSAHPPTIVIGQGVIAQGREDVFTFLVHRALKVIQANACVLARTAPIDLAPLLAAFLKALNPGYTPQGIDAGKLTDAYGKVSRAMPPRSDAQLSVLAADVAGTVGNRASTLGTAVNGWGSRAALLALGDPNVALTAIAWAGGNTNQPPAAAKDRTTWVGRNAEARELIVFAVSDAYAEARVRAGLEELIDVDE